MTKRVGMAMLMVMRRVFRSWQLMLVACGLTFFGGAGTAPVEVQRDTIVQVSGPSQAPSIAAVSAKCKREWHASTAQLVHTGTETTRGFWPTESLPERLPDRLFMLNRAWLL